MAQTKTYYFCNYSIMSGVTVTLDVCCPFDYDWTWTIFGTTLVNEQDMNLLKFTIPAPLPETLRVYYSSWSKTVDKGITTWEGRSQISVLFPAGITGVTVSAMTYVHLYTTGVPVGDPGYVDLYQWQSGTTLDSQLTLPTECTNQPSGCTVESLGTVVTAPTIRGAADGSIQFSITGVTGGTGASINWVINGVTVSTGSSATTYTYTGLTVGFYSVIAYQGFCYAQEADVYMPDGQFYTGTMVVTEPSDLTAANNPVILQIETAINSPNPQAATGTITIVSGATISEDDTITFTFTYPQDYTATFTSKGYPERTSYFLASTLKDSTGVSVGTNTVEEIATSLAECIQTDVVLRRLFYITNDSNKVYLVARDNTPNLNLTPTHVYTSTTGITVTPTLYGQAEFDGQLSADYSIYAEIYVDESLEYGSTPVEAEFKRIAQLELPFQYDNIHRFQLDSVLKNFVNTSPLNFNFTGFTTLPYYDVAFYCKYGEIFPLIANSTTRRKRYKGKTGFKTTVNAALDWEVANDMSTYLGTECTGLTATTGSYPLTGVTWLTNSPDRLYVQRDSKQFLSFLLPRFYASSGRTLSCVGDVYYYNGQSTTGLTFFQITSGSTTNFGGLTLLNVGYDGLGLQALESSGNTKVRRVDFAVYQTDVNGTYPLTEVKTFLYEIDEAPTKFGTAFLNKFGTWDIFDWVGEVVDDSDITREEYQLPREIGSGGNSPLGFIANSVYDTQYTKKHVVNSGTIDADTYIWLQELLQSNVIYSYSETHQNFLIVESATAQKSTNVNEYTISVTFRESLFENNVAT
jgi:hypothetical protein